MPESNIKKPLPGIAFILGMGRSGTTLLTSMLNMNPAIIATPENEFILFSYSPYAFKNFNDPVIVKSFINIFNYNYNNVINIWKPNNLDLDIESLGKKNYSNVCKLVYLNYPLSNKKKSDVKWVIDKNPSYSLHVNKLNKVFPEAKYIVIVRDYRDNVVSRKKYSDNNVSILKLAAAWNYFYSKIFQSFNDLKISHHFVKYEDLVNSPTESLQGICNYLGVDYTPDMLKFQEFSKQIKAHAKETVSEEKFQKISAMHSNLDNQVNSNRVDAYINELSLDDITALDYACKSYAEKFEYKLDLSNLKNISLKNKIKYKIIYMQVAFFNIIKNLYYKFPMSLRLFFKQKNT